MADPKSMSKTELVEKDDGKKFSIIFGGGKANGSRASFFMIIAVCIIALACLCAGIALMAKAKKCEDGTSSVSSASKSASAKEQCKYSVEAKRIGLDSFLKKVRDTFYKLHPENTAWHPEANVDKIRKDYRAYDPTPAKIKERTDMAMSLLKEINTQTENPNLLKPREYKGLLQVKHYLKYMFGMPYDENYYAGDWMLGPNSFCWQPICSLGYDIYNNIGNLKPRNYDEINVVIKHMKDINATIMQYISNMKLGIVTGMVRTKIECLGGLNAIKESYGKVSDNGPNGVLSAWYVKTIIDPKKFLVNLTDVVKNKWAKDKGKTVNETIREGVITYIGTPIHKLLQGRSHKGRTRHFTSEDELARQAKEVKNWRKRREDGEEEDDNEGNPGTNEDEEDDEEEEPGKPIGASSVIEVENPNRVSQKAHKVDALDVEAKPELTRREREALEKEQAKLRYQKLQAEGKTDEARADLARLAIIRKQREEAAKKKALEKSEKEKQQAAAAEAMKVAQESQMTAGSQKAARKKRK